MAELHGSQYMGGDPNYLLTGKALQVDTRWWQLKYVYFHPIVGEKMIQFDEKYFSNGWLKNHNPGYYWLLLVFSDDFRTIEVKELPAPEASQVVHEGRGWGQDGTWGDGNLEAVFFFEVFFFVWGNHVFVFAFFWVFSLDFLLHDFGML